VRLSAIPGKCRQYVDVDVIVDVIVFVDGFFKKKRHEPNVGP
jgi:hypothetical protein